MSLNQEIGQQLARVEGDLGAIKATLAKLEKILSGNGSPSMGLVVRFDRVEQAEKRRSRLAWITVTAAVGALVAAAVAAVVARPGPAPSAAANAAGQASSH